MLARCREFKCLPSQLKNEEDELLWLLEVEELGAQSGGEGDDWQ